MRNLAANLLTGLFVAAIVLLAIFGLARQHFSDPGPATEPLRLTVERGALMGEVADRLEKIGAIADFGPISGAAMFRIAARYSGKASGLKFGEYEIAPHASMKEILELLISGSNVAYQITVPEGQTVAQIIDILNEADFLTGEIEEIPPEGSLLPETYNVARGDSRAGVIKRMRAAMDKILAKAWEGRAPDLPLDSKEQLLILASIIQKETIPGEHEKVASVFINRLNKGMKLQTDASVIYGITLGKHPLGHGLTRSELDTDTPYNTYTRVGLPPTPISNPGRATIMATANPADTPYLYFVADGTGGHAFAETLAEHNRNVAKWRRIERQRKAAEEAQEDAPAEQN